MWAYNLVTAKQISAEAIAHQGIDIGAGVYEHVN
jgi:hypothetical protein